MHLKFFAKGEGWKFNEVDGFSTVAFDDFVRYGQRFQFAIHERKFMLWSKDFQGFVRMVVPLSVQR